MFATLILVAMCLAIVSADNMLVYTGGYCSRTMKTLPGKAKSLSDCSSKCTADSKSYKFFNWVQSSGQCLCSVGASDPYPNSYTDCYSLNCPFFKKCSDSAAWGPNSLTSTQPGVYYAAADCAKQCAASTRVTFKYFNYVANPIKGGSGQCQCFTKNNEIYAMGPTITAYALGSNSCNIPKNLRA